MKDATAIYWYLFWNVGINCLNELVEEAYRKGNFERVKFYCKIIALKSMNTDPQEFYNNEIQKGEHVNVL